MKQRMNEYRDIRHDYINDCRAEYGYGQRTKEKVVGDSRTAGFSAAMLGSFATIALFASYDPHGFQLMIDAVAHFSIVQFLEGVFSPLRGLFLDPWSNIF